MIFGIHKPLSAVTVNVFAYEGLEFKNCCLNYWGDDKPLARLWNETSYSDQDLEHSTKNLLYMGPCIMNRI